MVLFFAGIVLSNWINNDKITEYVLAAFYRFGFVTNLVLLLSSVAEQHTKTKFLSGRAVLVTSVIIAFASSVFVVYLDHIVSLFFSMNEDYDSVISIVTRLFLERNITGEHVVSILFWFFYCNAFYAIRYRSKKYFWLDRIVGKTGYIFEENIATVKGNTILFPRKFIYEKMMVYTPGDGRVMIIAEDFYFEILENMYNKEMLTENEIEFRKMLMGATSLNRINESAVEFGEKASKYIKMAEYEIIEHEEGWYELLPLIIQEKKEGEFSIFDIIYSRATSLLIYFGALTYVIINICLHGCWLLFKKDLLVVEYLTYLILMGSISQYCNYFILIKNQTKKKLVIKVVLSALVLLFIMIGTQGLYYSLDFSLILIGLKILDIFGFLSQ